MAGRSRLFRRPFALMVCLALVVAACAPQTGNVPATDTPSGSPLTPTLAPIDAPIIKSPQLVAIRMFDENSGWGISDTAILRTIDEAVTWHDVSPLKSDFGYAVTGEFIDALHGWVLIPNPDDVFSGILYRTSDGGAHWSESPAPFGGGALHFLDPQHGWMMASLGAGAGSMAIAVHQTNDSGGTWTQTYVNDPTQPNAGDSLPLGGLKDGITPLDMQEAWIGGVIYEPGRIYLYQTADGGHTWKESPVKTPEGYSEAELETTGPIFTSPQTAFLPVHMSSQNGVMLAIYVSHDGGTSWQAGANFIPEGGTVDFVSDEIGFAWNGSTFYVTNDGAGTWTVVTPDVDFTDSFSGMDFVSAQVGFVLSDDGERGPRVFVTRDAGATWNIVGN